MSREVMQQALDALVDLWNDHLDEFDDQTDRAIQALRSELSKPAAVPEGWAMVPRKPTAEMIKANGESGTDVGDRWLAEDAKQTWAVMLAAAPQPPAPDKPVTVVVTGSDHIVDANKLVTADFEWLRVVAVEAIRNLTGCPDFVGKGGACLTDELMRVAKLARLADFINSPPAPAVSPVDVEAVRGTIFRMKDNHKLRESRRKPDPLISIWANELARAIGENLDEH